MQPLSFAFRRHSLSEQRLVRRRALAAAALALLAAAPAPAQGKVGQPAPEVEFDTRFNFGKIEAKKLGDLKGSAVLVAFVAPGLDWSASRHVPFLNALHEEKAQRGLVVLALSLPLEKEVEKFVTKQGVKFLLAVGMTAGFGTINLPDGVLIDPTGKIVWRGDPAGVDRKLLDQTLATARPAEWAEGLDEVWKAIAAKQHGKAHEAATKLLAGETLSDVARTQAETFVQETEAAMTKLADEGFAAVEAGDPYGGFVALDRCAKLYAGLPRAAEAATKVAELQKDPKAKKEIAAGTKLAQIEAIEQAMDFDLAHKEYRALGGSAGSTKAGKEAVQRATAIEKDGKLGFKRGCTACEAVKAACPMHKKKR